VIAEVNAYLGLNFPACAPLFPGNLALPMDLHTAARSLPASAAPLRVLVIEDSENDFDLLVAFLDRGPWRIQSRRVEDEPGLRQALAEGAWDFVISDHSLPRFDSASALRVVREQAPELPFVIVSGCIGEDVAVDAMLAGADDYVMKQNLARLRPAIERCLAARELQRAKREAEARERETESRLSAIAAHVPGVVFELKLPAKGELPTFVYLSEGASALLERAPARLIADPEELYELLRNPNGESFRDRLAGCARRGEPLHWEGRVGGGAEARWVSVSASPRTATDGVRAWDGIMFDVSALKKVESRLRELTAHWERRMEEERAATARELHDDVGGTLTALKVDIDWLRRHAGESIELQAKTADMEELVDSLISASTRIALALRPGLLDYGISAALEAKAAEFAGRLGIPCHFRSNDEELSLSTEQSTALFRVFQETLTNVTRHAAASRVDVELFATGDEVTLEVRDDGCGIAPQDLAKASSFGIRGVQERVNRLGGWVEVSGELGQGSTVMIGIPRQVPAAPA
jgi:signal transduction histidine kinase